MEPVIPSGQTGSPWSLRSTGNGSSPSFSNARRTVARPRVHSVLFLAQACGEGPVPLRDGGNDLAGPLPKGFPDTRSRPIEEHLGRAPTPGQQSPAMHPPLVLPQRLALRMNDNLQ